MTGWHRPGPGPEDDGEVGRVVVIAPSGVTGVDRERDLVARWRSASVGRRVLLVEAEDGRVQGAARRLASFGVDVQLTEDGSLDERLAVAGRMLADGTVDACVAGAVATSTAVLRAALHTVGMRVTAKLVSSVYLMIFEDGRTFGFADCVVNPRPEPAALAAIAVDSARTYTALTGDEARVAMLSFSTASSARHPDVDRVQQAVALARRQDPDLLVDGEMQLDAALAPEVARLKAPESQVAGRANVLVFPSLEAGNIAYKLAQRLAGAVAAGPVLQGLAKPYFDISRGSSTEDIVRQSLLATAMATVPS